MRRSLVFLLALIFVFTIFSGPAAPKADAVVVSSIIVGTVIAAMAAAGIGLTVSGMTSSQLTGWVSDKLSSWANSLGGSVEDHINGNLITTTASGIISVGTSAAHSIAQFLGWLKTDENIGDNDTVTVISGGAKPIAVLNFTPTANDMASVGTEYRSGIYGAAYDPTLSPAAVCCFKDYDLGSTRVYVASLSSQMVYYWSQGSSVAVRNPGYDRNRGIYVYNAPNDSLYQTLNMPYCSDEASCLDALESYLNGNSESLAIETGVITIPTIDTTSKDKWFIDVGAEAGATIQTATDGVIADTIEGDLTVSGEVAEDEPEFVIDEPIAVTGLSEVFPFCIPFDIYALLSSLSADPQTPVFTARFVVPGIIDEEFTIDLTPFNSVAQIVRTLELLAFIIGLALVTRERFLRS